jgi:hypothetical protein
MGKKELSGRPVWQDASGAKAGVAETNFYEVFSREFLGSDFRIRSKPRELSNIYRDIELSRDVLAQIYHPGVDYTHGVIPDYAIDNTRTHKTLYVEVKRQDGWVEGKPMSAGRGNAHERSCKFFTPGLLKILREHARLGADALPFWVVFQGDIARDPKRVREITCWYAGYPAHFFFWRNTRDGTPLVEHFNRYLKHLLRTRQRASHAPHARRLRLARIAHILG